MKRLSNLFRTPDDFPKRIVLLLWITTSNAFLFVIYFISQQIFDVIQYCLFGILLYGAGYTYSVTSRLIYKKYISSQKKEWYQLILPLGSISFVFFISSALMIFAISIAKGSQSLAIVIAISTYLFCMLCTMNLFRKLIPLLRDFGVGDL